MNSKVIQYTMSFKTLLGGITNNFNLGLVEKPSFQGRLKNLDWVLSY